MSYILQFKSLFFENITLHQLTLRQCKNFWEIQWPVRAHVPELFNCVGSWWVHCDFYSDWQCHLGPPPTCPRETPCAILDFYILPGIYNSLFFCFIVFVSYCQTVKGCRVYHTQGMGGIVWEGRWVKDPISSPRSLSAASIMSYTFIDKLQNRIQNI